MTVRSIQTMRATITRTTTTSGDPFATFGPGATTITATVATDLACYIQAEVSRKKTSGGIYYTVTEIIGLFPLGTDVRRDDRLIVRDRRGRLLHEGLRVESLTPPRETHQEVQLERYG